MQRRLKPVVALSILTGLNLFNYLDRYVLSAVLEPIKNELHLSDGDLGRIFTAFMWGYFLTCPFFGYLGDRLARKWLIAAGIFVWSLGTVCTGFAGGLGILLMFRVMVGLGEASYGTISPSYISDCYPPAKRNNALTIFYVAIPVGAALGYLVGGFFAAHYGWRQAFWWAGAPGLALALVLLPFREPRRGEAEGKADSHEFKKVPSVGDVVRLLSMGDYVLTVAGYTAYTFAVGAVGYWGPTFLQRTHHMELAAAASFFGAVLVVAGLVGTLLGGFAATALQKRFKSGYASVLTLSSLLPVPLVLLGFSADNVNVCMGLIAAAMLFLFLGTGPVNTVIIETVPGNLRSSAMAISIFMIHLLGDSVSPEIVGRLSDRWGSLQRAVLVLPWVLLVSAAFYGMLVWRIRQRAPRRAFA